MRWRFRVRSWSAIRGAVRSQRPSQRSIPTAASRSSPSTAASACPLPGTGRSCASGSERPGWRRRRGREPPRFAAPPEELVTMISSRSPGQWDDELASAVLPIFEVGPDGLARARLPFDTHMQILDGLLDYDAQSVLPRVRCPAWLVSCESVDADDEWTAQKSAALTLIAPQLARPRVMRWAGAVHDVPLQWPDLVAGLIRSAINDPEIGG